jgi:hypothetical protein
VRSRLAWFAGGALLAGALLYRLLGRRPEAVAVPPAPAPDPRADELRRRLEEARAASVEAEPAPETEPEAPGEPLEPVDERRRRVHRRGRSAVEQMRAASPAVPESESESESEGDES